jgi:hypothetical protein
MKITIEHSSTKRAIDGQFNICGSRADLKSIADQILVQIDRGHFAFGWVEILDRQASIANTTPKAWDE